MRLWRGIRIVMRRRWKMNPEAFMLSDRLEKLMLASVTASLRSHSRPCRLHVARLKRYFIKVWGRSGRRPSSHRGHIFCPIRLIPAWMADLSNPVTRLALRTCTFCVRPHGSPLISAFFVDRSCREACVGAGLNVMPPLLVCVTQDNVELSDKPGLDNELTPWRSMLNSLFFKILNISQTFHLLKKVYTWWGEGEGKTQQNN